MIYNDINTKIEEQSLYRRFMRYIRYDTQSDERSETSPSTAGQWDLIRLLADELRAMPGLTVQVTEYGYVTACLPSNRDQATETIGFIAHVDTSPDMSGHDVHARCIASYDGQDIILNDRPHVILSPREFPELLDYIGQPLFVTDGTTLLGADDKAGVAEIMEVVDFLTHHPDYPHGPICVAFTPDEEIGRGTAHFPFAGFAADFAFTVDGGALGELQYENFNAAAATIHIAGQNIHPGEAKDKMTNALSVGMEIDRCIPHDERPEYTEGYQGFFHLTHFSGTVEEAEMSYLIRDHDAAAFAAKKDRLLETVRQVGMTYPKAVIHIDIKDQYLNMKERILPHIVWIEKACQAMRDAGVTPCIRPIRGGTDGAQLSYQGLPCPNLFTGGHNFHGKYEYIPYFSMQKACEVMLQILTLHA